MSHHVEVLRTHLDAVEIVYHADSAPRGADRAFILRFLNAGTDVRDAGTRGGRLSGNRGRIAPRNFFATSSHTAMMKAAEQLTILIDDMIKNEIK